MNIARSSNHRTCLGRFRNERIDTIKEWVGALTELALMLLALAIVLSLLVGANLPFFGAVTANINGLGERHGRKWSRRSDHSRDYPLAVLKPENGLTPAFG